MIEFVLVRTSHSGNIGATARALKTMGFMNLCLVDPQCEFPSEVATAMCVHAEDVLQNARVVATLEEALADSVLVLATTARSRGFPQPVISPEQAAQKAHACGGKVSIVMGPEKTGLTNKDLKLAHQYVCIPTNKEYSSLNVASAVQILAYELLKNMPQTTIQTITEEEAGATGLELANLHTHLEQTLVKVGYIDPANPRQTMNRLWNLLMRANPTSKETNMLRGLLRTL